MWPIGSALGSDSTNIWLGRPDLNREYNITVLCDTNFTTSHDYTVYLSQRQRALESRRSGSHSPIAALEIVQHLLYILDALYTRTNNCQVFLFKL